MSNKYDHHLLVIPEDEANRQIITGFNNHLDVNSRRIQVEPLAGGWKKALEIFRSDHVAGMGKYDKRHMLILIDLDEDIGRLEDAREYIPEDLKERVFVMGCLDEPETACSAIGMSKEALGEMLAGECLGGPSEMWQNAILAHNQEELVRMKGTICRYLRS